MRTSVRQSAVDRRRDILDFVSAYWTEHGYGPSLRDIAAATNIRHTSIVWYHLNILRDLGWVHYADGLARTLRPSRVGQCWNEGRLVLEPGR